MENIEQQYSYVNCGTRYYKKKIESTQMVDQEWFITQYLRFIRCRVSRLDGGFVFHTWQLYALEEAYSFHLWLGSPQKNKD